MGELVVKHYPTILALKAADHTYVECGTGAIGWKCWGGKQGGAELRRATGSTLRANGIAGYKERAGITCYLINGVCHQAANRILFPAGITVKGARGYGLSSFAFGLYGKIRSGRCSGAFNEHPELWGDLADCLTSADGDRPEFMSVREWAYMSRVARLYSWIAFGPFQRSTEFDRQMLLAQAHAEYRLPDLAGSEPIRFRELMNHRESFEVARTRLENRYAEHSSIERFSYEFDALTLDLQMRLAKILEEAEYEALLDVPKDQLIVLSDPDIVREIAEQGGNDTGPDA